jgi:hypothetical protein
VANDVSPPLKATEKLIIRHVIDLNHEELLRVVREQLQILELDLSGLTVVVGADAGYQAALPAASILAGADSVIAITRESKAYPTAAEAAAAATAFATIAGVSDRLEISSHLDSRRWRGVDIVANCPQIGSISRNILELLPEHALIALMAEPWELRPGAVDTSASFERGIKLVSPNLGHPAIQLYPELARLGAYMVTEAGIEPRNADIAIISDTPCAPFIARALTERGANTSVFAHPDLLTAKAWPAIVVAMRPSDKPPMNIACLGKIHQFAPEAVLIQFSGEIDRTAISYFGMRVWPPRKPGRGQLGLPLDVLGPGPTIRKLMGGMKAAETAYRGAELGPHSIGSVVETATAV